MGAVAITTLAGARLIIAAPTWSFLGEIAVPKRIYSVLLGSRYMVDSIVVLLGIWRFIFVALAAWLITFLGLVHSLVRRQT